MTCDFCDFTYLCIKHSNNVGEYVLHKRFINLLFLKDEKFFFNEEFIYLPQTKHEIHFSICLFTHRKHIGEPPFFEQPQLFPTHIFFILLFLFGFVKIRELQTEQFNKQNVRPIKSDFSIVNNLFSNNFLRFF
jgi:hypothetical protein